MQSRVRLSMRVARPGLERLRRIWLIVSLGALLSACAGPQEQPTRPSPLLGRWRSDCVPIGKRGRHGAIFALELDGRGRMLATSQMFARRNCVQPTLRIEAVADYEAGAPSGSGVAFDYAFRSFDMTLQRQDVVDIYNSEAFGDCAKREWRAGEPQSVLGGFCPPTRMPRRGALHRDAAFVRRDTMAFGFLPLRLEEALGSARPTSPSKIVFMRLVDGDQPGR
jgi:hypothetical protein